MPHKLALDAAQFARILRPLGEVADVEPLTGGMFAAAYRVHLVGGGRVVLKATRTDPAALCRYERGIARTEADTYVRLGERGLPVPELLLTDFSHEVVDGDVVVTRHLPGAVWHGQELDAAATARVNRNLGAFIADLHQVPAPRFGYPAEESGMGAEDWPTAFGLMVEGILADAVDGGTDLPFDRVRAALAAHAGALAAVEHPVLVHTDLWPANVFIDDDAAIVGIIDTERVVWGDPLLDLIGVDQFGLWDVDPDVLAGNAANGGVLATELAAPSGPARFALLRLYFSLLLCAEVPIRGYQGDWVAEHRVAARVLVDAALARLEGLAGSAAV